MLRLFNGRLGQETPELRWMRDRPRLLQLTLSAFRLAVKVAIDQAAMEEEVDMEWPTWRSYTDIYINCLEKCKYNDTYTCIYMLY